MKQGLRGGSIIYYVCPPMSQRDPTPKKVLYARSGPMSKVSRLSSGLDPRDPTPKKVLYAKSAPMSDRSWQRVKTFFGVGYRESFICEVSTYVWHVLALSRLSSGLDPQMSRDPTPKKVLYAKSAPMSDRSWQSVKSFFGVGSLLIKSLWNNRRRSMSVICSCY